MSNSNQPEEKVDLDQQVSSGFARVLGLPLLLAGGGLLALLGVVLVGDARPIPFWLSLGIAVSGGILVYLGGGLLLDGEFPRGAVRIVLLFTSTGPTSKFPHRAARILSGVVAVIALGVGCVMLWPLLTENLEETEVRLDTVFQVFGVGLLCARYALAPFLRRFRRGSP